jgi:hypothetical protein
MSLVRKKLYSQGKYLPTAYAYVWPRKEFLEWAEYKLKSKKQNGRSEKENTASAQE